MLKPITIDMDKYPRRDHFNYFRNMRSPYVGVTVDVEITALAEKTKKERLPFFLTFLYFAAKAANSVPELRQRIAGDSIVEYPVCPSSYTVALEDGTYCYCRVNTDMRFEDYLPYAIDSQERARREKSLDDGDMLPLFFISSVPWLTYSAIVQPTPEPPDSNPRITWGKYAWRDGKLIMPVTILCNHAIVDGRHIAEFYSRIEEYMADFV